MKIFLSAVSAQLKDCRDALASDLRAVGAEVVVQEDFQQHGRSLLEKLEQYIATCDRVIALVGDAYGWEPDEVARPAGFPRRSYSQWEYYLARGERLDGSRQPVKELYLYFASPEFIAAHAVQQSDDAAQLQQAFLTELRSSGKDWNPFSSLDQLRALVLRDGFRLQQRGPQPRNLPYLTIGDLFKGREAALEDLTAGFGPVPALAPVPAPVSKSAATPVVARVVNGMGGIGKTRLALEYAWRRADDYTALLFVGADSADSTGALQRNLAALCGHAILDLPEQRETDEARQRDAVVVWLRQHPGWLLILDNIDTEDDAAAVEALLPQLCGGHALLTSRLANWSGSIAALPLGVLSPEAATEFLLARTAAQRRKQADDPAVARTLAKELGRLALALEQAGAYIAQRRLGFARYLEEWQEQRDKVLAWFDPRLMQYPKSVAVTWQTSFERLGEPARRLLQRLAWLAPEPIPESLLDVPVPELDAAAADTFAALAELESYSLITRAADTPTFSVHRLVQEVTRRSQRDDPAHTALAEALRWVDAAFVGDPQDVRNWPVLDPLAPHARAVAAHADAAGLADPTTRLLNQTGLLLLAKAQYAEAEPLTRRALAIDEASFGADHPRVAIELNNLASLLQATNRLPDAEPLMRRALAIDEASFGADHPRVAIELNNLASLLQATNRLPDAEPLMRRALAIDEASFGADHPRVAIELNNLAQLLQATNRLAEAEPLMRRALAIDEASFGADHPKVAIRLNNLALLLQATNRLPEAEPLMRRALAIDEASFGADHPDVARDLNNLAGLLKATHRLVEAEPLMRRALAIDEASFGADHPEVATDLNNLAQLLQDTNPLPEAEPLMRRALAIDEASFGADHPSVARDLNNLAQLLQATHRWVEAEPLMRRALEVFIVSLGTEHPNSLTVAKNYVGLLQAMGRTEDEIKLHLTELGAAIQ